MALAKQKVDWERTAQISFYIWYGQQQKQRDMASFNPMSDKSEAVLKLNREESTEFLLKNAPVDRR